MNNPGSTSTLNQSASMQKDTGGLTDYEIYRAQNVERNQTRLCQLGLITEAEAKTVIDAAWKRNETQAHNQKKPAAASKVMAREKNYEIKVFTEVEGNVTKRYRTCWV